MTEFIEEPELRNRRSSSADTVFDPFHSAAPLTRRQLAQATKAPPLAALSMGLALVALTLSFFFGWGLALAVVAVVIAMKALRQPARSHSLARWALALGMLATIFSTGWLIWLVTRLLTVS